MLVRTNILPYRIRAGNQAGAYRPRMDQRTGALASGLHAAVEGEARDDGCNQNGRIVRNTTGVASVESMGGDPARRPVRLR